MYRQIWVTDHHQDYHHQMCHLKTVTHVVIIAYFLAISCLQRLSEEDHDHYTNACRAIRYDFYMGDLLSGTDTNENALILRNDIIMVLKTAAL